MPDGLTSQMPRTTDRARRRKVDGSLIAIVCVVRRVVIMAIDDVFARFAYSKIARLAK